MVLVGDVVLGIALGVLCKLMRQTRGDVLAGVEILFVQLLHVLMNKVWVGLLVVGLFLELLVGFGLIKDDGFVRVLEGLL